MTTENWTVEDLRNRKRKRVRRYNEWVDYFAALPPEAHEFEKQMAFWAMRLIPTPPQPPNEVKRVLDASVSVPVPVHVPSLEVPATKNDFDLASLFREQQRTDERSLSFLSSMMAPQDYRPVPTVEDLRQSFENNRYFISQDDIFSIHQAIKFGRPIKVEGKPGTGKTELAKQIAIALGLDVENPFHFMELFCTPDVGKEDCIYRWNDARRLIDMELLTSCSGRLNGEQLSKIYVEINNESYSPRYLDLHVLLKACVLPYRTVVLVDEIDKTYPEFDSYLLDIVDKNYFVVPEMGRVGREKFDKGSSPIFILTTNRNRELSGPLARRTKALFYEYLPENLEAKVIAAKTSLDKMDAGKVAAFFRQIRTLSLQQAPSTAEVLETATALVESKLEVTNRNIFRLRTHWVKNASDFSVLKTKYLRRNTYTDKEEWAESL